MPAQGARLCKVVDPECMLDARQIRPRLTAARREDQGVVAQRLTVSARADRDGLRGRVDVDHLGFPTLHVGRPQHIVERYSKTVEGRLVESWPDRQPGVAADKRDYETRGGAAEAFPLPRRAQRGPDPGKPAPRRSRDASWLVSFAPRLTPRRI